MKNAKTVACVGLDCHRKFSIASARDGSMGVVWRRRLEHADRNGLRKELSQWPTGTPVILEATFGWGWMSDGATGVRNNRIKNFCSSTVGQTS